MQAAGRLKIGLIGAGKAGAAFAGALQRAGHEITRVSAISENSVERASCMLPDAQIVTVDQVSKDNDMVIVAAPSQELATLVSGLATLGCWYPGQIIVHLAIDQGLDVLEPAADMGAIVMAIHPLIRFTGTSYDIDRLNGVKAMVTCNNAFVPIATALCVETGMDAVTISDYDRKNMAEILQEYTESLRNNLIFAKHSLSTILGDQAADIVESIAINEIKYI